VSNLRGLTVLDIEILAKLPKMTSIRSFAQNLDMTPSFLSKKIRKLESELGVELVIRNSKGIIITHEADTIITTAREILDKVSDFHSTSKSNSKKKLQTITIGTRGFLNSSFATTILNHFSKKNIEVNFRFIDMSPNDQINSAKNNEVDIYISLKDTNYGDAWQVEQVGDLNWSVFASKGHPLSKYDAVEVEQALVFPFTKPSYWDGKSIMTISDSIPLDGKNIIYGHGVQNTQTAIAVISSSLHLSYIPKVAAKRSLELGEITEIQIIGIRPKKDPIFLAVHTDKVTNKVYNEIKNSILSITSQ
jgi:DNA-binding transcriptional LysR family regulator